MSAYAVAHMRQVTMGPPIVEYLKRIDATLAPFGGRFIVHGGTPEVLEGSWPGFLIVIEFPSTGQAAAWYKSGAYQQIAPLRTGNSDSDVILVEGVGRDHRATDVLAASS
ncbi:MAG TPA: DUF1330 domain-containing protein [Streptosporangiaceae bacterium]|jgi:uncharacterized protein (DUF1330 family)